MSVRSFRRSAAVLALFCTAPLAIGATGLTTNWQERVLNVQNQERRTLDLPPLRWNQQLAVAAQAWANHLANTGGFGHAPERNDDPQGENLWAGTRGYYSAEAMVNDWVREKRHFRQGIFPQNSDTGRVEDVGHYTQIVWRGTHDVGCALTHSTAEDLLVCRYSQAGNWEGEKPF